MLLFSLCLSLFVCKAYPMAASISKTTVPAAVDDPAQDGRWLSQHHRFLMEARDKEPEVVFLGDSMIQRLQDADVWKNLFQPMHCLNFGIGGDSTQHLLWRIVEGELDSVRPKVIVILIGTNNFLNSAEEVAEGIEEIVRNVREKQPQAHILVVEIFPRGEKDNIQRQKNARTNELIRNSLRGKEKVRVVNLDPGFVGEDGSISPQDMPDYLHFSNKAYTKSFTPLAHLVTSLLEEGDQEASVAKESGSGDL
ncbi:hypothetical protein RvY_15266 [Ramazzottius varieornatus]|uniref:SGNH hydrolase-type esterase domain-containing protein n=1 Tax=Ramazzottius varieornatus TaxID=947166 RepID=A0A1D1VUA2_RAMVA|nr:hypothetical protein RvY_15266 [Ramazzottius varieornatus]